MKNIYIKNASNVDVHNQVGTFGKNVIAEGNDMIVSDGYHTFDELYEHRYKLFIALATLYDRLPSGKIRNTDMEGKVTSKVWRTLVHSDGTPSYEGYFLMGVNYEKGEQMSYHLPMRLWDAVDFAETLEIAPEFDGHTSMHVIERLANL